VGDVHLKGEGMSAKEQGPDDGAPAALLRIIGETTITGKNQISLPAAGLRAVGWERGDHLLVEVLRDDMLVLVRRPTRWADAFAGKLGHVFGSHEENAAFLEAERRTWDDNASHECP
jgi:hypothetical protein